jgi:hypothetical protein
MPVLSFQFTVLLIDPTVYLLVAVLQLGLLLLRLPSQLLRLNLQSFIKHFAELFKLQYLLFWLPPAPMILNLLPKMGKLLL